MSGRVPGGGPSRRAAAKSGVRTKRGEGRRKTGRGLGRPPNPHQPPALPEGKVNITDPDSKSIPVGFGFVQGYNAQAAVNEQQIVLAAEITNTSTGFSRLAPMVTATLVSSSGSASRSRRGRSPPTPATETSSTSTRG